MDIEQTRIYVVRICPFRCCWLFNKQLTQKTTRSTTELYRADLCTKVYPSSGLYYLENNPLPSFTLDSLERYCNMYVDVARTIVVEEDFSIYTSRDCTPVTLHTGYSDPVLESQRR